jgi:hypothetical protein
MLVPSTATETRILVASTSYNATIANARSSDEWHISISPGGRTFLHASFRSITLSHPKPPLLALDADHIG